MDTPCKHIKALARLSDKYGMNVVDLNGNSTLRICCAYCADQIETAVLDYPYLYYYGEKSPRL